MTLEMAVIQLRRARESPVLPIDGRASHIENSLNSLMREGRNLESLPLDAAQHAPEYERVERQNAVPVG